MSDVNPYESREAATDKPAFAPPRWQILMTRIVVLPFGNIFGLLLMLVMVLPMLAVMTLGVLSTWSFALIGLGGLVAVAIDVRWRLGRSRADALTKWLSWYEGGTFLIFPSWIAGAAWTGLIVFLLIVGILHHKL